MKISTTWLQQFFDMPLPAPEILAEGLMFHAFEVESVERRGSDSVLEVKVTPNRGHDCLSHRGIAKEIAAIFNIPFTHDPFVQRSFPKTDSVLLTLDPTICKRYMAARVRGVTVGPSPTWLRERLETIGQRSINNVVDITNFVMYTIGQPLHAFAAHKLTEKEGKYSLGVRNATQGESLIALDEKTYELAEGMPVIVDTFTDRVIGIAGVKGGQAAAIDAATTDLIIESANFNSVAVRKTAQALKLRTDASQRFEQDLSPEVCTFALQQAIEYLTTVAGGELVGVVDVYPEPQQPREVSVSTSMVKEYLGAFGEEEIRNAFTRLDFAFAQHGEVFTVQIPVERLDLLRPADLVEEVVRIIGYDKVPAQPLPPYERAPQVDPQWYWIDAIRTCLTQHGCSEIYTSVFAEIGEVVVLNKVDGTKPYLRDALAPAVAEALEKNVRNKELLGISPVQIFEIGTVWKEGKERIHLAVAVEPIKKQPSAAELLHAVEEELHASFSPVVSGAVVETDITELLAKRPVPATYPPVLPLSVRYRPFSKYPFIVRDIAVWAPVNTTAAEVHALLERHSGPLCTAIRLFDTFAKEGRVSYAFRLIFQSFERTLLDSEANAVMAELSQVLSEKGFEIR